jgi:hypothetical protein
VDVGPETTDSSVPAEDCISTDAAESFSFFVTSMFHLIELSGSENGFGGDLRYNGAATGLEGADAICQELARRVCHGQKTWRAFLSTSTVDAIDRIGTGPWYDHSGALVAEDVTGLAGQERPAGGCCDEWTLDELGEYHDGEANGDDHDTLTGSNTEGRLDTSSSTCDDWTSTTASGSPRIGHSWPRSPSNGRNWVSDHNAGGCAAGINTSSSMGGGGGGGGGSVGSGGGYGAFYCFAE